MTDIAEEMAKLEAKQEEIESKGKIDPCDTIGAIATIADAFDIDPLEVLRAIKGGARRFGEGSPEQVILDIIEISQSNFDKGVNDLEEWFALEEEKMTLEE